MKWKILFILFLFFSSPVFASDKYEDDLHDAASNGNIKVAEKLLSQGHDIEAKDRRGQTPIYYAIYYEQVEMVKFLLERGANPNVTDKENMSPVLMIEFVNTYWSSDSDEPIERDKKKTLDILRLLIKHGASLNHRVENAPGDILSAVVMKLPVQQFYSICLSNEDYDHEIAKDFYDIVKDSDYCPDCADLAQYAFVSHMEKIYRRGDIYEVDKRCTKLLKDLVLNNSKGRCENKEIWQTDKE